MLAEDAIKAAVRDYRLKKEKHKNNKDDDEAPNGQTAKVSWIIGIVIYHRFVITTLDIVRIDVYMYSTKACIKFDLYRKVWNWMLVTITYKLYMFFDIDFSFIELM